MIVLIVKLSLTSYTDGHMPLLPNKLKQTGQNNNIIGHNYDEGRSFTGSHPQRN